MNIVHFGLQEDSVLPELLVSQNSPFNYLFHL